MGDDVLPRAVTGAASNGYPFDAERAEQLGHLNPDVVYIVWSTDVDALPGTLGDPSRWIYAVAPIGALTDDPEPGWTTLGSKTCLRAVVIAVLRRPSQPELSEGARHTR